MAHNKESEYLGAQLGPYSFDGLSLQLRNLIEPWALQKFPNSMRPIFATSVTEF